MIATLLLLALPPGPHVGFVDHYPWLAEDGWAYGESGATLALVRVPWTDVQPDPDSFVTANLDRQLDWAEAQGVRLLYVVEAGPAHAPNWVAERCAAAGESLVGSDGRPVRDPSLFSPTYRALLDAFVPRAVRYLAAHPKAERILGYCNGCEWWFPDLHCHGPLESAAFDAAMTARHGSRAAARAAWGLAGDEPLRRPPVILEGGGAADGFAQAIPLAERFDGCLMTHGEHVPVAAGRRYRFTAEARLTQRRRGFAYLQIAWLGDAPQPLRVVNSTMASAAAWTPLEVADTAPPGATRAWLLLKTCAVAETHFRAPAFRAVDDETDLLADSPLGGERWTTTVWESPEREACSFDTTDGVATIRYLRDDGAGVSAVWIDDWYEFMGGAAAEFIGTIADRIRAADPTRPIVTYLTFSFGAPFAWDDSYSVHIHPDRVFAARRYDGLGMQLASADGDAQTVTAGIDLVRHLGEPWLIDLQDFTAGVHIGREAMTRVATAGVAAGARGVVWYGWYDSNVPDYSFRDGWPAADTQRMVAETRAALAAAGPIPAADCALLQPRQVPIPGRGEPGPGRFMIAYRALRQLGYHPRLITRRDDAPPDLPLFTVDDVPPELTPTVRRSTEAGNTPPMFKWLPTADNERKLAELVARWRDVKPGR